MSEREHHKTAWAKMIRGDAKALSDLYNQHYLNLLNYGRTIVDDRDLVNDCFMQMLIEFWDKRKTLADVENIRSYLMTSLRRAILYRLKTEKRRDMKQAESISKNDSNQFSYEEHLVRIQADSNLKLKIGNAMKRLTERQKELVKLKFFDNLSYDEIARLSNITKRTAYNIIYDAIKILKEELYQDQHSSFQSFFSFFL